MYAAILFSIIGLSFDVVSSPSSFELVSATSSCQCGLDCSCGRTATPAPVQPIQAFSCENGICSINKSNVAPPSTIRQPTYTKDIQYIGKHYQPVKRGLFGRKSSCRGGQCGR